MMKNRVKRGRIILFTGISGSGKTRLGLALQRLLKRKVKKPVAFIDGDKVRHFLGADYGFSEQERFKVTQQIAFSANCFAENGVDVIVANIAGRKYVRDYLRKKWKKYIQIFLDADIQDCIRDDPKGVYKKALKLKIPQIIGHDLPYDKPRKPDLTLYSHKESRTKCLRTLEKFFRKIYRYA